MNNPTNLLQRSTAAMIATIVLIFLLMRIYLATTELGALSLAIVHLSQFFTILTNLTIGVVMLLIAFRGSMNRMLLDAMVVAIVGVGLVYHLVLSQLWSPEGLALWADHGVHTVVPVLTLLWWLKYSQTGDLTWSDLPKLIIWPLIYSLYALVRAHFSGFYPYPFLNLEELGKTQLLINIIGLCLFFQFLGWVIFGFKRLVDKRLN